MLKYVFGRVVQAFIVVCHCFIVVVFLLMHFGAG